MDRGRFAAADTPGWAPPTEEELRRHFDDDYLSFVPPDKLTGLLGALARGALRPQAERDEFDGQAGLGWMLMPPEDVAGHPGAGCSASLTIRPGRADRPWVVLTNRQVLVEPVIERPTLPIS